VRSTTLPPDSIARRRPRILAPALAVALCVASACTPLVRQDFSLRVLVFNIHAGKDAAGKPNLNDVANLVRSTDADLAMLQEVDRTTRRSGNVDQIQVLSDATNFASAFGRSLDYDGGQYGIAALSRTRFDDVQTFPLPTKPQQPRAGGAIEPRAALVATARTPLGPLTLVTTHLDASATDEYRLQEATHLLTLVQPRLTAEALVLVGGDFNAEPGSRVLARLQEAGLRDAWTECGSGDGFTYPAVKPTRRIDYLFLTGRLTCTSARVIETNMSDHRPLLVTVVRKAP
jgi:endonuclease/exonuclease/phosphatase family metal-dependent hydrolase